MASSSSSSVVLISDTDTDSNDDAAAPDALSGPAAERIASTLRTQAAVDALCRKGVPRAPRRRAARVQHAASGGRLRVRPRAGRRGAIPAARLLLRHAQPPGPRAGPALAERVALLQAVQQERLVLHPLQGRRRSALHWPQLYHIRERVERGFLLPDVAGTMAVPRALGRAAVQEIVRKSGADEQAEAAGGKAARRTRRRG
ncbi:hypothetical protein VPH35_135595 [Triticum aestivum]